MNNSRESFQLVCVKFSMTAAAAPKRASSKRGELDPWLEIVQSIHGLGLAVYRSSPSPLAYIVSEVELIKNIKIKNQDSLPQSFSPHFHCPVFPMAVGLLGSSGVSTPHELHLAQKN